MRFFAVEQLGPKQSLTPEGFLVCHDVAIGRVGMQTYSTDELPMLDGIGGRITIYRDEADVFHPDTLASFEGKPVTIDHPPVEVDPSNWRNYAVGTVQNVRRGSGVDADLIVADLLITDQSGIDTIRRDGVREVSCGYDAEYEQAGVGVGYQRHIIGNHVAIVERGRAGPRCSIQDHEPTMTTLVKKSIGDKLAAALAAAFGFKDAAELEKKFGDAEEETPEQKAEREKKETQDTIARLVSTVDALTATVAKLTKDGADEPDNEGDDEADPTEDSVGDPDPEDQRTEPETTAGQGDSGVTFTGDALTAAVARAEILVPGFTAPTHDSAATEASFARAALAAALKTTDAAPIVSSILGGRDVATLTADAASVAFVAASEMMRAKNNSTVFTAPRMSVGDAGAVRDRIAQMNAAAASHWKQ